MNELIRELKEQAGITTNLDTDYYDKKDANKWMDYFAEKFAELIVRECLSQIYRKSLMATPEHKWRPDETAYNEGVFAAYDQVKKHFGLK